MTHHADASPERAVIITGAAGGLGSAISRRLAQDGFLCVLAGRNSHTLERVVAACRADGGRAVAVACDVRDPGDREALLIRTVAQGVPLFGLINNAGVAYASPLLAESLADWRETLTTNLEAGYFLSQLAIGAMRQHGAGRIVNISSAYGTMAFDNRGYGARAPENSAGDMGPYRQSAYAASKGGLLQLTRDLAAAVGRWGILVNAVSPGSVPRESTHSSAAENVHHPDGHLVKKPGLSDEVAPDVLNALAAQTPLRRLGSPHEIAGPVSFLLSDDAAYITGANLPVDGGWTLW